jgi:cell division protein FtsI (penicillin-binding protein 3)
MVADKIFSENMGAWGGPLDSLAKNNPGTLPAKAGTARGYQVLLAALDKRTPISFDYMNIMTDVHTDSNSKHITVEPKKMYRNMVPDVTGMGLRDAVYVLENSGLLVTVVGKGKVAVQSIPAGTRVIKGQTITLQLS